nr:alpha/beta hydrolase-fold protein [Pseudoxanthomonas sp. PXM04]
MLVLIAAVLLATAMPVVAQPDLSRRIGTTVADTGAPGYRFERVILPGEGGGQGYRFNLAIPLAPPHATGYPAVWLLDGNAALMEIPAALLQALAKAPSPPLLVFVAHDNDLRIDSAARAHDYTPRLPGGEAAQVDPLGRRNGGADGFLDLLTGAARERVRQVVPLDDARQAIWGHSYGGVFVLHALFSRPDAFATYAAVDPSLWWGEGYLLKEAGNAASATAVTLWLAAGENGADAASGKAPPSQPSPASGGRGESGMPNDSLPRLRGRAGVGATEAEPRPANDEDSSLSRVRGRAGTGATEAEPRPANAEDSSLPRVRGRAGVGATEAEPRPANAEDSSLPRVRGRAGVGATEAEPRPANDEDSSLPRVRGRVGVGAIEAEPRPANADRPDHAPMRRARDAVPPGAAKDLVERQRARGVEARYVPLPGLSHGQTLGASLPLFLPAFAGMAPP